MHQKIENQVIGEISNLHITKRSRKFEYKDPFFIHLDDLKQFEFLSSNSNTEENDKFSMVDYLGLEQFVFENTTILESNSPDEIDWVKILNLKDRLSENLKKLLNKERNSEVLKPVVDYTLISFEKYMVYSWMHPDSMYNPYIPTHEMLKDGYIYLINNKSDLISEFKPRVDKGVSKDVDNIGLVIKAKNEKKFRSVLLDSRFRLQNIVLKFLSLRALGYQEAKSKKKIVAYLVANGEKINVSRLNSSVLLPLKRVGLIGSSSNGFYYINTDADLRKSFNFHKSKYDAIKKTLEIYKIRGESKGMEDLKY